MPTEERVLCFQRKLFEELGVFQGLSLDVEKYLPVVTSSSQILYLNRSEAEQDKRYKQLIPYVLILCNDRILRYRRGKGGQETRLHGFFSVGIGGHISEEDHGLFSQQLGYHEGMRRELKEEVEIEVTNEAAVAVINDDSTEVGFVHFGVVHVLHVTNEDVVGRRSGIVAPEFVPIAEAVKELAVYESWSRFCLENLDALLSKAEAAGVRLPERISDLIRAVSETSPMTIKQYQERVADFPTVMDQSRKALDACLLGLISTTGRFQKLANGGAADSQVASELAGEMLWLLAVACNELQVDLQAAAETHLRELAEMAKRRPE